jgi:two-component system chemotaxis response regulator CheY
MKVLVVDDFATMRKVVRNMLPGIGYDNVNEAENGDEGFRMAKSGGYGLIVSDWNMPVMTGLEFLKAIQADASNYIVKPFTPQVFEEKLTDIFDK